MKTNMEAKFNIKYISLVWYSIFNHANYFSNWPVLNTGIKFRCVSTTA